MNRVFYQWFAPAIVAVALLTAAILISDDPKITPPLVYRIF